MKDSSNDQLFLLGKVVVTAGVLGVTSHEERQCFLLRHRIGSWEETPPENRSRSLIALLFEGRIRTEHQAALATVWIITEDDRSVTTILLPQEY